MDEKSVNYLQVQSSYDKIIISIFFNPWYFVIAGLRRRIL